MLVKKCFTLLVLSSFLTAYSQQEDPKNSTVSLKTTAGIVTVLVGVPVVLYWYQNYFTIDRMSVQTLLNNATRALEEAESLQDKINDKDLDSIANLFPDFPYPYMNYHAKVERAMNHLIYYERGLLRKLNQGKLTDTTILDTITPVIEELEALLKRIEKTSQFKQEKEEKKFFGSK